MAAEATPQTTTPVRSQAAIEQEAIRHMQAVRVGAVPLMPMSPSDAPNT